VRKGEWQVFCFLHQLRHTLFIDRQLCALSQSMRHGQSNRIVSGLTPVNGEDVVLYPRDLGYGEVELEVVDLDL